MPRTSPYLQAIASVLTQADGPRSAEEVHEALSETGVGIATVYRLLNRGVEEGRYIAVAMPDGPTRFEPADRPHHHHFHCRSCDKVYDVMGCPGHPDQLVPDQFQLETHDLLLHGQCSECTDEPAE